MRKSNLYLGIAWVVSVVAAYLVGWWSGVSGAAHVASSAARSGLNIAWMVLLVVAIVAAVAAFRARGYLDRGSPGSTGRV